MALGSNLRRSTGDRIRSVAELQKKKHCQAASHENASFSQTAARSTGTGGTSREDAGSEHSGISGCYGAIEASARAYVDGLNQFARAGARGVAG
jgi:hypothetical protein